MIHRTSNGSRVEQVSGLCFWASRPKMCRVNAPFALTGAVSTSGPALKLSATPNLTGVMPVPPTALNIGCPMPVVGYLSACL